ncbi:MULTISPECIES: TetR/AcrR family transcriptional regulator [Nocardiopsis]|uniref:TetR family transcriptional regulator n=1 Tax=Nocardiopsis alba TaxID=53437 RepID=A0A7K2IMT2_9ACTN|nr:MULTISPECIES: TetR/AcrR family transcriptional regulator [Nocardiopsis]MEC3895552.1 TetR family transcriptional regulator [Nocardiopsis sp. LDBS1602]MYR31288.1 TetR family transcriptional regulator [Nocardiopsis alba]
MVRNPERRAALLDAAIAALAEEGARGLTFRAVDTRAGVPAGTASNYFADRDDLLAQTSVRTYERFMPGQAEWDDVLVGPRDRAKLVEVMRATITRMVSDPEVYLATLELQLEATRRPDLRRDLTARVRADLDANIAFHEESRMPGGRDTVLILYLALNWMVTEHLTLPGVLAPEGDLDTLVARVVEGIVLDAPSSDGDGAG